MDNLLHVFKLLHKKHPIIKLFIANFGYNTCFVYNSVSLHRAILGESLQIKIPVLYFRPW